MKPAMIRYEAVSSKNLKMFEEIKKMVEEAPDDYDCHQICAAISKRFPILEHKRGHFLIHGCIHSWLVLDERPFNGIVIIDPYPVAAASGPIMVSLDGILNSWEYIYREDCEGRGVNRWHRLAEERDYQDNDEQAEGSKRPNRLT